jgi:hypothetical protein
MVLSGKMLTNLKYSKIIKFHDNPVRKVCKSKEETLEHILQRSNSAGLLRTKLSMVLNLNT